MKMLIITILLVCILLCMFKPVRQLVGLLFLLFVGAYWYGSTHPQQQQAQAEQPQIHQTEETEEQRAQKREEAGERAKKQLQEKAAAAPPKMSRDDAEVVITAAMINVVYTQQCLMQAYPQEKLQKLTRLAQEHGLEMEYAAGHNLGLEMARKNKFEFCDQWKRVRSQVAEWAR
jgi:hypothetical protein